jgi:hypothetical protein
MLYEQPEGEEHMGAAYPGITQEELDRLSDRGQTIYDQRLKGTLEPEHNGKTVAIHLESGDYAIGKHSPGAMRAIRKRCPDGMIVTMKIGPTRRTLLWTSSLVAVPDRGLRSDPGTL